jgi:diguanylate cyclase (GGDEF)-like protein/PAS domain S-box-containing protein
MKVLIVDDDEQVSFLLKILLQERGYEITACSSAEDAMVEVKLHSYPLIVLDIGLPGMNGKDFCSWIRQRADGESHYILFVTGNCEPEILKDILSAGGNDYLEKRYALDQVFFNIRLSFAEDHIRQIEKRKLCEAQLKREKDMVSRAVEMSPALLIFIDEKGHVISFNRACRELTGYSLAEVQGKIYWDLPFWPSEKATFQTESHASGSDVRSALRETEWITKEGKIRFVSWSFSDAFDAEGVLEFTIGAGIDITERRDAETRLAYLAEHDSLTDLYNRSKLTSLIEGASQAAREGRPTALLYIDLDNFKNVNDVAGHGAGDRLIMKLAAMLKDISRAEDNLVRFGGDEFVIILHEASLEEAREIAERYRAKVDSLEFEDSGETFNVSTSIGLAVIDGTMSSEELVASVDSACYTAKARGRNRIAIHTKDENEISRATADVHWAKRIKGAIRKQELELWFQPILNVRTGEIDFHEALLRLRDEPALSPCAFLGAMHRTGGMPFLDRHVVELATQALVANPDVALSVNISAQSANDTSFFEHVAHLFDFYEISYSRVLFEITETALMFEPEKARPFFEMLKKKGFRFALDDFGVGFSSLGYLRHLPIEILKVDGVFIKDLARQPINQALVQSINQTAHILKLQTVAEFVEDEETLELIGAFGFDFAQGYYIGKPSKTFLVNKQLSMSTAEKESIQDYAAKPEIQEGASRQQTKDLRPIGPRVQNGQSSQAY